MTLYMIRFGDDRVDAYVEGDDPRLLAAMRLLEDFGCPDGMAEHIDVRADGKGGAIAKIRYTGRVGVGDYTWGLGNQEAEAVAQVATHDFEKHLGGPDLWTAERWLDIYRHEARAAQKAFDDAEWQRDRDVDIEDGTMPDIMHRY